MRPSIRNCWHLVGRASEGNDVTDRNSQPSRRRGSVLWVLVLLGFGLGLVCAPALAQTRYRYHRPKVSAEKPKMTSARAERRDLSGSSTSTRLVRSSTEAEGKKVEREVLERLSIEGRYEPSVETEVETIQVDPRTTRIIRRLFGRDPDGRRTVVEVTEEEQSSLPGGRKHIVRTSSKPNLDGHFRVTRREIQDTTPLSRSVQRTRTTVLLPNIDGTLAPAEQVEEVERQEEMGVVEVERTHLLPDANGRWEPFEIRERVVRTEAAGVQTEERIRRRDPNGKLSLAERTVTKQWKDAEGHERQTVETYSRNIAGTGRYGDGRLHLDRRLRIVRSTRPDGSQRTVQQMEQRSIVAPSDGLRVAERVVEVSRPDARGGTETRRTVQALDGNNRLRRIIVHNSQE